MVSIVLNNDMIKNYKIYGDENIDIQMGFFLQQMKHIIFLGRVRKLFI